MQQTSGVDTNATQKDNEMKKITKATMTEIKLLAEKDCMHCGGAGKGTTFFPGGRVVCLCVQFVNMNADCEHEFNEGESFCYKCSQEVTLPENKEEEQNVSVSNNG